jgi:hypothetical protein
MHIAVVLVLLWELFTLINNVGQDWGSNFTATALEPVVRLLMDGSDAPLMTVFRTAAVHKWYLSWGYRQTVWYQRAGRGDIVSKFRWLQVLFLCVSFRLSSGELRLCGNVFIVSKTTVDFLLKKHSDSIKIATRDSLQRLEPIFSNSLRLIFWLILSGRVTSIFLPYRYL